MCRKIRCDTYYAKNFGFWGTKRGLSTVLMQPAMHLKENCSTGAGITAVRRLAVQYGEDRCTNVFIQPFDYSG